MKCLLKLLLLPFVLVIAAVVTSAMLLDSFLQQAIERGGSYALGVETKVESVDIGLGSEIDAGLDGLSIANPEGFDADQFLGLGGGSLSFGTKGLFDQAIHIPELALNGIAINLERRGGKNNYDVILENLEKVTGGKDDSDDGGSDGDKDKDPGDPGESSVTIDRVVLSDITATIDLLPIAGDTTRVTVNLSEVVVEDVADMSTGEVIGLVIQTLLLAIAENAGDVLPVDMLNDLNGKLGELGTVAFELSGEVLTGSTELMDKGKALLEQGTQALGAGAAELSEKGTELLGDSAQGLGEELQGLSDEAAQAGEKGAELLEQGLKGAGEKADEALKGLGGILGGKKKKD